MLAFNTVFRQHASVASRLSSIAMVILVTSRPAFAQAKADGRWIVQYEHETRGVHVGTPQLVTDSARVTLRQRGDSVLGEWQAIVPAGDAPAHPRVLRGTIRGEIVRLQLDPNVQESEGYFAEIGREIVDFLKEHIHGIPPMITQLELTLRGDAFSGSRWSASADGSTETTRRPLRGSREKL
jgi:hypothetical protein